MFYTLDYDPFWIKVLCGKRYEVQFFAYKYSIFPAQLKKNKTRTITLSLNCLISLLKINRPYMCRPISEVSVLFHWIIWNIFKS